MSNVPLEVDHGTMREAMERGLAWPLSQAITDFVRYNDAWWLLDRDGWLRVTDGALAAELDAMAVRMASVDKRRFPT